MQAGSLVQRPMTFARYHNGRLSFGEVPLDTIAADMGTPCYVYWGDAIVRQFRAYDSAFGSQPHRVCYAVKANGNLSVLRLLAEAGSGFDIVSGGELYRVLQAGADPSRVVFSGVGKTAAEMHAALQAGISCLYCESLSEIDLLADSAAKIGRTARIGIRVNPGIDAATHPYIATGRGVHKFGIDIAEVHEAFDAATAHTTLKPEALSFHLGSQLLDPQPILVAVDKLLDVVETLRSKNIVINTLNVGGGLGVAERPSEPGPDIQAFVNSICKLTEGYQLCIEMEPGRSIVSPAGVLITTVLYRKHSGSKEFIVVDAAMNDMLRPALYQAYHEVLPVGENPATIVADLVGPICESGDFFAQSRLLPDARPGDVLAILNAGAYGFAQSSNYNARPRPPEVLVEDDSWRVVRVRESFEDIARGE
jgi:diaminopimelate decarboxylase